MVYLSIVKSYCLPYSLRISYKIKPLCNLEMLHKINHTNQAAYILQFRRHQASGGDLAPSLGGRKKFSRTKISEMTIFSGKIFILTPKISDDFFLVIDLVFQILRCLLL